MTLPACVTHTTETVRTVSDYCLIAKGITYSEQHQGDVEDATNKYDTNETVTQVKNSDLVFQRLCAPKTP